MNKWRALTGHRTLRKWAYNPAIEVSIMRRSSESAPGVAGGGDPGAAKQANPGT